MGPIETRGLVGKNRSQRCLSGDPNPPDTQRLPQVSIRWQNIPLRMPAIRTILSALGLHKTLKPALALLCARGVRLIAYIDDILVLAESKELLLNHLEGMSFLLEYLGFIICTEKSVMIPNHVFLGLTVNSTIMELGLPPLKIKQIRAEVQKLMRLKTISARHLAQLLGKINATVCIIPPAPLFYCHLQMALSNSWRRATRTTRF